MLKEQGIKISYGDDLHCIKQALLKLVSSPGSPSPPPPPPPPPQSFRFSACNIEKLRMGLGTVLTVIMVFVSVTHDDLTTERVLSTCTLQS